MVEREMHDAVCSECKQPCQVPFIPATDRPVYCLDCWKKKQDERKVVKNY